MNTKKVTVAEQYLAIQHTVAQVLAESPTATDAGTKILQSLSEGLDWPLAARWTVDSRAKVLRCVETWRSSAAPEAVDSRQLLLPGEGLPGAVWRSGAPVWIPDISADVTVPVGAVAAREGYHAALGFPIALGSKILGVIELFCREVRQPNESLLRVLASLGRQIGLFFELKRTEEDLRESEERSRLLLESSGEGIYGLDLEGNCTFANPACARLLGYNDPGDLLGKQTHDLFHHTRPDGSPYPRDKCRIYQAFQNGKAAHVDDEVFWRRDGSSFPVEYRASAIRRDGRKLGAVVTFVDTSQRKKSEEAMRLRESALRAIGQGVFITDPARDDEPLSYVNVAFEHLTGYTLPEVKGRDIEFLRGAETEAAAVTEVRAAYRQGRKACVEVLFYHKDGSPFWATLSVAPVNGAAGSVSHFVGVLTDITERKHFEKQLLEAKEAAEAANVAKSQFLASMSHELRTPLNAVMMYSELLQEESEDRGLKDFIPDLEKIRLGGKHLLALVNGVLDLSKIEAGKMDLSLETFNVAKMVDEVVGTVQPLVGKKDNKFNVRCPTDVGEMHADLTKVRQILFNLVSNACKFTEKGTITLDVARSMEDNRELMTFIIRDTGIGMTPEQIGRLFQPFSQADASTTRKYGGTGLGLVITRHFCEMMGGKVTVSSKPGEGSTFTVRLPTLVAVQSSQPSEAATAAPSGVTVLVIDDDPAVRDFMTRAVAAEGVRVVTAADGEDGLRVAAQVRPAVIFLDVLMPRMDGWSVLSALKANPALVDIPVVMMTIMNEMEMGYVLGASEYLGKPIERNRLITLLHKYRVAASPADVLIVEDDETTRQVLRRTLAKQGWTVAEADNGRVALEKVARHTPSLILLDLMMPGMDGFEFLSELRKNEAWQSVPVVVLTSKDLSPEERRLLSGNVERILQKGAYGRDVLLREVRRVVAQYTGQKPEENKKAVNTDVKVKQSPELVA